MKVPCNGASPWDLSSSCVRISYSALVPAIVAAVVFLLAVVRLPPLLKRVVEVVISPLKNFLPLPEAEALLAQDEKIETRRDPQHTPFWPTAVLSLTALLETLVWIAVGSYLLLVDTLDTWHAALPYLIAVSWLYACCRPILKPTATPPYDLVVLYLTRTVFDAIVVGGVLYDKQVYNLPLPALAMTVALVLNLVGDVVSMLTVFSMPLSIPSAYVDPTKIVSIP
jgi:hypothetical protein